LARMSERNVDLHRRTMDAYNARDIEAWIALADPQIEFHSTFAAVGGAVYHGHDGLRRYFRDIDNVWGAETRLEAEAFFDLGENTLVFQVLHGRGRHSGAQVAMPVALVVRWRDGMAVYMKGYARRRDALRDLGVSESELEPIAP
jgi:ketosteroid isomerase-like protein